MASASKDEVATMLRSVLSSEKNGVPLRSLEREYILLIGNRIPYRDLGYNTLEAFLASLPGVVKLSRGATGDMVAKAVATESTLHVAQMVAGQKSTKSKPVMRSTYRHPTFKRRAGYRPISLGHRAAKHEQSLKPSNYPVQGTGSRGVYQPRRSYSNFRTATTSSAPSSKQYEGNATASRSSSFEVPPRFRKSQHDDRCSPDFAAKGDTPPQRSSYNTRQNSSTARVPAVADSDADWGIETNRNAGDIRSGSERDRGNGWCKRQTKAPAGDQNGLGVLDSRRNASGSEREGVTGDSRNAHVSRSHWATWGDDSPKCGIPSDFGREADVPLSSITRTVTFDVPDKERPKRTDEPECSVTTTLDETVCPVRGAEKPAAPSVEPSQPRFNPFREALKLSKKRSNSVSEAQQIVEKDTTQDVQSSVASEPAVAPQAPAPLPRPRAPDLSVLPPGAGKSIEPTSVTPSPSSPVQSPTETVVPVSRRAHGEASAAEGPYQQLVANHAYRHGLTPVYTTNSSRSCKRGPLVWLATLKLDGRTYNSYPNERETEVAAREEAAKKAVVTLKLSKGSDSAFPVSAASTPQDILALEKKIAQLVAAKPRGLLNTSVPDLYKSRFRETLPENWLDHIISSQLVSIAGVDGNRCILYGHGTELPSQNGHSIGEPEMAQEESSRPTEVDEYIDVFITCITGTDNVCFRFIEYADEYDELMEKMKSFYNSRTPSPVQDVVEEELYAICANGEWLRVQTESAGQNGQVEVTFVDRGDTEIVAAAELYKLEPEFAVLPLQAIRCQLDGLAEYSSCDDASEVLVEMLLGKTLVAEIIQKEDPVIVVLYDTWSDVDLNLNLEIVLRLAVPVLPKPGFIGRAQLSHVDPSGDVYLQILGPGLESLLGAMATVNEYYENNNDMVESLVAGKLYACRFGCDRTFYRAMLLSSEPELSGKFPVLYVDFGNKDSTFVADLREIDIFGNFVTGLPHQAVKCRLHNVLEHDSEPWSDLATSKLWEAVVGSTELLVKVMGPSTTGETVSVALFRRMEPNKELVSINADLAASLRGGKAGTECCRAGS